jgi:hypothetical protein
MKAIEIIQAVQNRKGQHVKVTWQRPAKTLKDCALTIAKRTSAYVRAGIEYANLATVKEAIASGERDEVQSLPSWSEWVQYPFISRHKQTGQEYVRLYPAVFANLKPEVEWSIGGKPATYAECEPYLLASEKRKDDDERPACFSLKAEDVIAIA